MRLLRTYKNMNQRTFSTLKSEQFDLIIIGSGIHGAILAFEAARAGYRIALVDKDDFGSSTSANSLKIIHGGIRYLQHLNLKRMRESILSRRAMMRFAPHLIKPLACLMPTYGHGMKGRELMRIAFYLYDLIAFDRNQGLTGESLLPAGGALSRADCQREIPGITEEGLNGAALWHDALAINTERLLIEYVNEAARYGAVVANYTEATQISLENNEVDGVFARDILTGDEFFVRAKTVINTTGPWVDAFLKSGTSLPQATSGSWAKALNIVVKKRFFNNYAVGLEGWSEFVDKDAFIKRGKRLFFFVPWRDEYTMIGTSYKPFSGDVDQSQIITEGDIQEMIDDINKIYPEARLGAEDVTFYHGGLLPRQSEAAAEDGSDTVQLEKSTRIIDHAKKDQIEGFISISGVKYTTSPAVANQVINILKKKGIKPSHPFGSSYKTSSSHNLDHGGYIKVLGYAEYGSIRSHLMATYGSSWRDVFFFIDIKAVAANNNKLWICRKTPLLAAELHYFIEHEQALKLADVVLRRSPLGSAECPADDVQLNIADIMAEKLEWSEDQKGEELNSLHFSYQILQGSQKNVS